MKNYKSTLNNHPLRSLLAAVCAWAVLVSLVPPVVATEVPETTTDTTIQTIEQSTEELAPATTTATIPGTTAEAESESSLEETLRAEIAAYNERNGISPEMPDSALANAYFTLDSAGAKAAWEDAHAIIEQGADLTTEEAETLQSEKNTKLFLRFYDIMVQINSPATIGDFSYAGSSSGLPDEITVAVTTSDGETDPDPNGGTITATATGKTKGGCESSDSARTTTITITSSAEGTVSFKWEVVWSDSNNIGTITVNGTSSDSLDNRVTDFTLGSGKSYVIVAKSAAVGGTKATVTLKDFVFTPPPETAEFTFDYDATLGSITVAGTEFAPGDKQENVPSTGVEVTATPASTSVSFLGWIDENGKLFSESATATLIPTGDATVRAVFIDSTAPGWYLVSKTHLYNDLNAASDFALTQSDKSIVLLNDATLPAGDYTIDAGVTFLVPFDADGTCYVEKPVAEYQSGNPAPSGPYRTLTMAKDAKLTVNGTMSVSSKVMAGSAGGAATMPKDKFGHVLMQEGSSITVNGKLSVYGYITGSGSVVANSGANLYECFQVMDFRGGTATSGMNGNSKDVLPLSQYYVQNIEVPLTIHSGAIETAYVSLYMSDTVIESTVSYIGSSGCLFNLTSGYLIKQYDKTNDRLQIDIHGDLNIASFSLNIKYLFEVSINSADYVLPITNSMTVNLNSGTVTIGADMAMLPGSQINIGAETKITLASGKRLYLYDLDEWSGNGFVYSNSDFKALKYVYNRTKTRTASDLSDALISVAGTLDTSNGFLYTTESGAAITGVDGGTVKLVNGTETATYQATQSGTTITYAEVTITSAKLQNGDTSYVTTTGAPGTYTYAHGKWLLGEHTVTSVVTAPTCTKAGYTTHTCACGYSYTDTEVAALGHSYDWTITTAAKLDAMPIETGTCTRTGCTATTTRQEIQSAQIGETKYNTLQEALTAAASLSPVQTVVLLTNFTEDEIPVSQTVTIEKGNYTATITAGTGCRIAETTATSVTIRRNPTVVSTNIAVNSGLDLYFYVPASDIGKDTGAYEAVVTKEFADDRTDNPVVKTYGSGSWEPYPSAENLQYYRFGFDDISAKEMTDKVTVVIKSTDGSYTSTTYEQTIQNYVITTLAYYEKANDNTQKTEYLRNALVDMLVYGTAAQEMFEYNESVPAWDPDGFETLKNYKGYITSYELSENENQKSWDRVAGVTISARNKLLYTFYFSVANPSGMYAEVVYTHHNAATATTYTVYAEDFYERSEGLYGVDVPNLSIVDGFQLLKCTLYDKDGNVIGSGQDSIAGYAYRNQSSADIYLAMMRFVKSAQTYFYYKEPTT